MAVLVESCEKTKSGKAWRVRASGQYYNAFLDSGIENYVGKYIEAEIHTHEKYGSSIAAFKPVAAPQVPVAHAGTPPPTPAVAAPYHREPTYAEPAKPGTVAPWFMPFISNTVNAAIAAGHINTPAGIQVWALAARGAALAAERGQSTEDDSSIPF